MKISSIEILVNLRFCTLRVSYMPKKDPQLDGYITLKEAAKISGYSADYIGQLIRKGKIRGRQVYTNIAWVTTEEDLRAYLRGEAVGGEDEASDNMMPQKTTEFPSSLLTALRVTLWALLVFSLLAAFFVLFVFVTSSDRVAFTHRGGLTQHTTSHAESRSFPYAIPRT